jgi:hypothetical protein
MAHTESPDVNASERSKKSQAETAVLLEAEVGEATSTCGGRCVRAALRATVIAKAYLQTEIERLIEAISTGFARGGCARHLSGVKKVCSDYD